MDRGYGAFTDQQDFHNRYIPRGIGVHSYEDFCAEWLERYPGLHIVNRGELTWQGIQYDGKAVIGIFRAYCYINNSTIEPVLIGLVDSDLHHLTNCASHYFRGQRHKGQPAYPVGPDGDGHYKIWPTMDPR